MCFSGAVDIVGENLGACGDLAKKLCTGQRWDNFSREDGALRQSTTSKIWRQFEVVELFEGEEGAVGASEEAEGAEEGENPTLLLRGWLTRLKMGRCDEKNW